MYPREQRKMGTAGENTVDGNLVRFELYPGR